MTALRGVLEATWPPAAQYREGPWTFRDGMGGGKRVSAATAEGAVTSTDLDMLEAKMSRPLVAVWADQRDLDTQLAQRGFDVVDETCMYSAPLDRLTASDPPPVTGFSIWPPLQIQRDIWAEGGIGPARIAVMERACGPKTTLLGRARDQAAATAFVALDGSVAMIHAIETRAALRRLGAARHLILHAAHWAHSEGARELCLLVTKRNSAARALYTSLGMTLGSGYHYRIKSKDHS